MFLADIPLWAQNVFFFLADDPITLFFQVSISVLATVHVFIIFFATRDILLRFRSFLFMVLWIVVVACVPLFGYLFYRLFRPPQTLWQREQGVLLCELHEHFLKKKK